MKSTTQTARDSSRSRSRSPEARAAGGGRFRVLGVLGLFLLASLPSRAQEARPILPIDQIERGQTGYGLSVFAGTEPERFEVEVLGVVRNDNPGSSFILARLSGGPAEGNLERTGVIRGMSGSPVFIDGKLVGAVAFSWSFVEDAIAGITPIEEMRRLQLLPPSEPAPVAGTSPPVPLDRLLAGELPPDLLERQLAALAPPPVLGRSTSLQWAAAGFGEGSRGLLEDRLGGIAPMGSFLTGSGTASSVQVPGVQGEGETAAPPDPQPGDALALVLVDGDFKLGPAGTVTDRTGDSLVAFGHPFLAAGSVRVPMAEAEVVTVVASQSNSFKITNLGRTLGAIEQDRDAGIEGRLGVEAPMIPVTIRVRGADENDGPSAEYHVRVAAIPQLAAGLMSLAVFNSLDVTRYTGGNQGLDLTLRVRLADHGDLELRQSFDGATAAGDAIGLILATVGYVLQNDLEPLEIENAEVELVQYPRPRTAVLVGAHAERSVVRPGQKVNLNLDLLPYRDAPFRRSVQVEIPEDVPEGRYFFFVGDGSSIDAARLTLEPSDPIRIRQALRLIRSLHTRRQLGVLGFFPGPGLAVAGEVMPQLPGSMASIWGAAPSGSARPLRLVVAQELYEPVDRPLEGLVRIDLEVRRHEPVTPGGSEPEAGAAMEPGVVGGGESRSEDGADRSARDGGGSGEDDHSGEEKP
jgi:hypothetical protein